MAVSVTLGHRDPFPVRGYDFDRHKTAGRDFNLSSGLAAEKYPAAELRRHVAGGRFRTGPDE